VYPAVDLFATAGDLARFSRAILRDGELDGARILSAASVRAMLRAETAAADQAIGWQLRTIGGRPVIGHEGEDAGATTGLFLDLASGTGALVLANGDAFGSGDKVRAEAIQTMISGLLATTR
jgi:CubicO group peptidase (beta-lactamase class C family)